MSGELFWFFNPHAVLVCKAGRPAVFVDSLFLHQKLPQRDAFPSLLSLLCLLLSNLGEPAGRKRSTFYLVSSGEFVNAFLVVPTTRECSMVERKQCGRVVYLFQFPVPCCAAGVSWQVMEWKNRPHVKFKVESGLWYLPARFVIVNRHYKSNFLEVLRSHVCSSSTTGSSSS